MKLKYLLSVMVFLLVAEQASACEEYQNLSSEELKEYRGVMLNESSDPFDKLFAFEKLSCSDNPNVRAYAIETGFKHSVDPLVRNQVLLVAMMQKQRVDIELSDNGSLSKTGSQFFDKNSGIYSLNVAHRSRKEGCLSLSSREKCTTSKSVFVKGNKVEYNHGSVVGKFTLSDQGELVGFVRYQPPGKTARLDAVIKLF